jgi:hypothetical protein
MRRMFVERVVWGAAFSLLGLGAMLSACGQVPHTTVKNRRATSASSPAPTVAGKPITQIVLERVGGGPQYPWQKIDITLQRPADTNYQEADVFNHLSRWLETSGFFTRKSGYIDPAKLFPSDVGHLMIKVMRGDQVAQVWSYNGDRDDELWETETMIRGTEATLLRYQADLTRIQQGNRQHSETQKPIH